MTSRKPSTLETATQVAIGRGLYTTPTHREHLASPAFMVICDGDCDQIVGTKREADREAKDLKGMGFENVKVKAFATWEAAHKHEDKLRGY